MQCYHVSLAAAVPCMEARLTTVSSISQLRAAELHVIYVRPHEPSDAEQLHVTHGTTVLGLQLFVAVSASITVVFQVRASFTIYYSCSVQVSVDFNPLYALLRSLLTCVWPRTS